MEVDINFSLFLTTLQRINSSLTPSEIARILTTFQHEVNVNFFRSFKENEIVAPFKTLWQIFFETYPKQAPQIKLMIARVIGVFLTRLSPYFADQLIESFFNTAHSLSYDEIRAPLIIGIFVFLAKNSFPKPFLDKYYFDHIIFEQFSIKSPDFSEHIAPIINNLYFLGFDWLKRLLTFFLEDLTESPGRQAIRAISATIGHFPVEFLNLSIAFLKDKNIYKFLSIFAFFFASYINKSNNKKVYNSQYSESGNSGFGSNHRFKNHHNFIKNRIDFKKVKEINVLIEAAFSILKNIESDEITTQNIDDALQILSVFRNLEITTDSQNNSNFIFKFYQQNSKNLPFEQNNNSDNGNNQYIEFNDEISVPGNKLVQKSSFYRLPLPIDLLKPNIKENVLISTSKFNALINYARNNQYIDEISEIFNEILMEDYNDFVSSAIQASSSCFDSIKLCEYAIRNVIFAPVVSWYHSVDILTFIQSLNMTKINEVLAMNIVDILIEFSLSKNAKLTRDSSSTIIKFANLYNYEKILTKIIQKVVLLDSFSMERLLPPITKIIEEFGIPKQFQYFIDSLVETSEFMNNDFLVICAIFELITVSSNNYKHNLQANPLKLDKLIYLAYIYVVTSYEITTGHQWGSMMISVGEKLAMSKLLVADIDRRNIDIVIEPTENIDHVLVLMKSALRFIFAVDTLQVFDFLICEKCFELFPFECTEYLFRNWVEYENSENFLKTVYKKLKNVNDYKTIALWCKIAVFHQDKATDTISFLILVCLHYFENANFSSCTEEDYQIIASFAIFLLSLKTIYPNNEQNSNQSVEPDHEVKSENNNEIKNQVIDFLKKLDKETRQKVLYYAKIDNPNSQLLLNEFQNEEIYMTEKVYPVFINEKLNEEIIHFENHEDPNLLLEKIVHTSNVWAVERILAEFLKKNIKIKIPTYKMRPMFAFIISKWISFNQINTFSLLEALGYIQTDLHLAAISSIELNPDQLLIELCCSEKKISKQLLINLCGIIGAVRFDKNKLFNLCNLLLYESKKIDRQRIAMRLFTTSIKYANSIPNQIVDSFIEELGGLLTTLPFYELTMCVQTIGNLITVPSDTTNPKNSLFTNYMDRIKLKNHDHTHTHRNEIVNSGGNYNEVNVGDGINNAEYLEKFITFAKTVRNKVRPTSSLYGNIQMMIFRHYKQENFFLMYAIDEEENLLPYLESSMPSLFLNGLRQFEQCLFSMTSSDSERFIRNASMAMVTKAFDYIEIPFLFNFSVKILVDILSCGRYNYLANGICPIIKSTLSIQQKIIKNYQSQVISMNQNHFSSKSHTQKNPNQNDDQKSQNDTTQDDSNGNTKEIVNDIELAIFPEALDWLPWAIFRCYPIDDYVNGSIDILSTITSLPQFEIAMKCIETRLALEKSSEKKDNIILDSIMTFLEKLNRNDSYFTINYLCLFAKMCKLLNPTYVTMIFIQFYMKSPRFFPFFAAFLVFIKDNPDNEAISLIKTSIKELSNNEIQKKAIDMLEDPLDHIKALKTAQFSDAENLTM
ncbi:hypothetical protein TRFO_28774 [Tritrichomonas foetus]|uniref:Uncharacterized protein n=1 Tax=Tritrichomonas foetus TaxID=1144522 RepID=A0A1J4K309_9EUKA|nr:hypothetical protein TRFO_28774 [Tritrichomonas foetus]|eukprot:OHT03877.1 hypothetical protein TRFO_28774 [Tritrichomonas foetus]